VVTERPLLEILDQAYGGVCRAGAERPLILDGSTPRPQVDGGRCNRRGRRGHPNFPQHSLDGSLLSGPLKSGWHQIVLQVVVPEIGIIAQPSHSELAVDFIHDLPLLHLAIAKCATVKSRLRASDVRRSR